MPNKHYNESETTVLTADPYYLAEQSKNYGVEYDETSFFSEAGPYTKPDDKNTYSQLQDRINCSTRNIFIVLHGYAGCGKTILANRLLYEISKTLGNSMKVSDAVDFEIGYGSSLTSIYDNILDSICWNIIYDIIKFPNIYDLFIEFVNRYSSICLKAIDISGYMSKLVRYNRSIPDQISSFNKDLIDDNSLVEVIKDEFKDIKEQNNDINISLSQLLAFDCTWRYCKYFNLIEEQFVVVFDNIDVIDDIETVYRFFQTIYNLTNNLDKLYNSFPVAKGRKKKYFKFLVTAREITWYRVYDYNENADRHLGTTDDFSVSQVYSHTNILTNRIKYIQKKSSSFIGNRVLTNIESLKRLSFVQQGFYKMFNSNYRICCRIMTSICESREVEITKCLEIVDDAQSNNIYSGASSVFFRVLFDYLSDNGVFDMLRCTPFRTVLLNKRNLQDADITSLTSVSRILLMYIQESNAKSERRLNRIFDFFKKIYNPKIVTDTLIRLITHNDFWRRTIYIETPVSNKYKQGSLTNIIESQMKMYHDEGRKHNDNDYCIVSITDAGKYFLKFVVSHFEYYSSRCCFSPSAQYSKPLFCCELEKNEEGEKYLFEEVIDKVLVAVKNCCIALREYKSRYIEAYKMDEIDFDKLVFIEKTKGGEKQLHEEKIIFDHIYYLETYRKYLLNKFSTDRDKTIEINKRLIPKIQAYLDLKKIFVPNTRYNIVESLERTISDIEDVGYDDKSMSIEYKEI